MVKSEREISTGDIRVGVVVRTDPFETSSLGKQEI